MCKSMIPKNTLGVNLALGTVERIETNSYDCKLFVNSGEVYIKTSEQSQDADAFIVKENQSFEFCGSVVVKAKTNADVRIVMFDRL